MATSRHPMPPELLGVPLDKILNDHVGRFKDKTPDWNAFEDAKIEGFKRAQHRFIGAGGSGKHSDNSVIPPRGFTLSIMYVVLDGFLTVFVEDEAGNHLQTRLGKWECLACPPGVIHGYQNESLAPVYFQVMLGRAKPEAMGYSDDSLFSRRADHLK